MIELALAALLTGLAVSLWAQYRAQRQIERLRLHAMRPATMPNVARVAKQRKLSKAERRLVILADDCDQLARFAHLGKCHSRSHMCQRHKFSEYRWNNALRVLRHLDLYDGELLVSYSEARRRLRAYFAQQIDHARRSESFVAPV